MDSVISNNLKLMKIHGFLKLGIVLMVKVKKFFILLN